MSTYLDPEGCTRAYIAMDIPNSRIKDFMDRLTGNDKDIVLAAEKAMNAILGPPSVAFDGGIELDVPMVHYSDGSKIPLAWVES